MFQSKSFKHLGSSRMCELLADVCLHQLQDALTDENIMDSFCLDKYHTCICASWTIIAHPSYILYHVLKIKLLSSTCLLWFLHQVPPPRVSPRCSSVAVQSVCDRPSWILQKEPLNPPIKILVYRFEKICLINRSENICVIFIPRYIHLFAGVNCKELNIVIMHRLLCWK